MGSLAREEKMVNLDLLDQQGSGVSKVLQAVQEMSDPRVLLDLLGQQVLLAPTESKGTRGKWALESRVPEEREETRGPEERRVAPAWMENEGQRVPQGFVVLVERRETPGRKVTKERRGTPCWWEDLPGRRATKERQVTGDPKVCREKRG